MSSKLARALASGLIVAGSTVVLAAPVSLVCEVPVPPGYEPSRCDTFSFAQETAAAPIYWNAFGCGTNRVGLDEQVPLGVVEGPTMTDKGLTITAVQRVEGDLAQFTKFVFVLKPNRDARNPYTVSVQSQTFLKDGDVVSPYTTMSRFSLADGVCRRN